MSAIILDAKRSELPVAVDFLKNSIPKQYSKKFSHIHLVVEEIFVNISSYAYMHLADAVEVSRLEFAQKMQGKVKLEVEEVIKFNKTMLLITVSDWGKLYNPFIETPEPDLSLSLEERDVGGLGVHLIKNIVKDYNYSVKDNANTVQLFFEA